MPWTTGEYPRTDKLGGEPPPQDWGSDLMESVVAPLLDNVEVYSFAWARAGPVLLDKQQQSFRAQVSSGW